MNPVINWKKYFDRTLSLYKTDLYMGTLPCALKKHFDFDFKNLLSYGKGEEVSIYTEGGFGGYGNVVMQHVLDSIKAKKDPMELLKKIEDNLVKTSIELSKKEFSSKEELIKAYNEFVERMIDYQLVIWFPVVNDDVLYPYAEKRFKELGLEGWDDILETFDPSTIQEEFMDLLKVGIDFSEEKLIEHTKKYSWMSMRFFENTPLEIDYFRQRLNEIKNPKQELERIEKDLADKKEKFFNLLESVEDSDDKALFLAVNKLNYLRQRRDDSRRRAYYNIRPFFEKILEALGCDYSVLLSYMHRDIVRFLENGEKISKNPLEEYVHVFKNGEFKLVTENIKEFLEKEGIKELNVENIQEVKGTCANKGVIKGKVKIIALKSWREDIHKVEKGDILVAVSTKPDYIVAMERASAFVTDEGGVTCHAAIVSREMGKPCIIGAKIATKAFKNGDMVEVDADKGIVRKI